MLCKSLFYYVLYVQLITQTILPLLNCWGAKMINANEKFNNRHCWIQGEFCHTLHFSSIFYCKKVQRRVKMFYYSPIYTNSFSSTLQEYWYPEFKETNPYNLQILLSYWTRLQSSELSWKWPSWEIDYKKEWEEFSHKKGQQLCIRAHITLFPLCTPCILTSCREVIHRETVGWYISF